MPAFTLVNDEYFFWQVQMRYLRWVVPIQFGWAEQPAARIAGESTRMFILGVDRWIRLEFTIDPFRYKCLELRGVVTSSAVSAMPQLIKT